MVWLSAGIKCCSLLWQPWHSQLRIFGTNKCHNRWGHWKSPGTHRWQLPKHACQEAYVLRRTAGIVWRIYALKNCTSWLNPAYYSWCSDFITGWSTRVWYLSGTSKFLLLWNVQTVSGAIPVSDCFLWKLNGQDVKLTTDLHLVLRLQMSGALPLFLIYTLHPRRPDSCDNWYLCSVWVKRLKWNNITKFKLPCQTLYW